MVEGERAAANLAVLHGRVRSYFARVEPFEQFGKYLVGLMSELPRKNGWTIAEYVGDRVPNRTQRLLNQAVWDHHQVLEAVRGFVVEQLGDVAVLRVAALDESGQEKQGTATAGVKRQYMGCAGRVANGVNTVYCAYATPVGHALVGARLWVPAEQLDDPDTRAALGVGQDVVFRTKPELAQDILNEMITDQTMPPWVAGDEVYGRAGKLRTFLEEHGIGYVMRVGSAFRLRLGSGETIRADAAVTTYFAGSKKNLRRWETCSVTGSKGKRVYAWAWLATASPRHFLLVRKHVRTGELAYHYCHVPAGQTVTLTLLVQVACLRWPVEEGFEFAKDHFGLDHSQVRLYTALTRHIILTIAALAVCAITAADARTRAPAPILPTTSDDPPPQDPGLIALTVAEIKRLFLLVTRQLLPETHHLHWTWWRRRHQARARWHHHRTRLRKQAQTT
jgi:SRSO17 transposase